MMLRLTAATVLVVSLMMSVLVLPAAASCMYDERSTDQQIAAANVVFVGTVIEVTNRNRSATFQVEEVWKGPALPERVKLLGGPEESNAATSVDRSFSLGVRYLAFPFGESPEFTDNSCSPTREWSDDLATFRPSSNSESPEPLATPAAPVDPSPEPSPSPSPTVFELERLVGSAEEGPRVQTSAWVWIGGAIGAFSLIAGFVIRRAIAKRKASSAS